MEMDSLKKAEVIKNKLQITDRNRYQKNIVFQPHILIEIPKQLFCITFNFNNATYLH